MRRNEKMCVRVRVCERERERRVSEEISKHRLSNRQIPLPINEFGYAVAFSSARAYTRV